MAQLDSPFIFTGEPWLLDRRLGPGGFGPADVNRVGPVAFGADFALGPFPCSGLDPREQAGLPVASANEIFDIYTGGQGYVSNLVNTGPSPACDLATGFTANQLDAALLLDELIPATVIFRAGREVVSDAVRTRIRLDGPLDDRVNVCLSPSFQPAGTPGVLEIANDLIGYMEVKEMERPR